VKEVLMAREPYRSDMLTSLESGTLEERHRKLVEFIVEEAGSSHSDVVAASNAERIDRSLFDSGHIEVQDENGIKRHYPVVGLPLGENLLPGVGAPARDDGTPIFGMQSQRGMMDAVKEEFTQMERLEELGRHRQFEWEAWTHHLSRAAQILAPLLPPHEGLWPMITEPRHEKSYPDEGNDQSDDQG
jgi:hypothetical protein